MSNAQVPNDQIPMTKGASWGGRSWALVIRYWSFFGHWVLGHSCRSLDIAHRRFRAGGDLDRHVEHAGRGVRRARRGLGEAIEQGLQQVEQRLPVVGRGR